jgi:hypothetical protein
MDYSTLSDFRLELYHCFGHARDALMNTCDALLTETAARSLPELSLSPFFTRRWPSLYEALDAGGIDRQALQRLFVSALPRHGGQRTALAADASPIVRAQSPTARDRTYVHVSNLPQGAKPVAPGWQFATIAALPQTPSSWTTVLDSRRIPSGRTPGQTVADQLRELSPLLPPDALVLGDGGFGNPTFLSLVYSLPQGERMSLLLRTAKNRTLYRPAPPRTGKKGAPRKDGGRFALAAPETHGAPDQEWAGTDDEGRACEVACWHGLHFKKCRQAPVSVLRVCRPGAPGTEREPGALWLLWQGGDMPALSEIPSLYRRRFSIEHGYRFDKQSLLWDEPRLRTPEKFETWTHIVGAVHNQITLAHALTPGQRHPWESQRREATPQQVRRACGTIIAQLGTPAAPPRVRGKSPGRACGASIKGAPRFRTIFKQADY